MWHAQVCKHCRVRSRAMLCLPALLLLSETVNTVCCCTITAWTSIKQNTAVSYLNISLALHFIFFLIIIAWDSFSIYWYLISDIYDCLLLYGPDTDTDIDYGFCHFGKLNPNKGAGLRFAALSNGNLGDYTGCGYSQFSLQNECLNCILGNSNQSLKFVYSY